jgi:DNA mismatch repair ATPase MutS
VVSWFETAPECHLHRLELVQRLLESFHAGDGLAERCAVSSHLLPPQGIFATHLHSLLDMDLDARRLVRMRMETAEDGRFIRATMRMLPGQCTE